MIALLCGSANEMCVSYDDGTYQDVQPIFAMNTACDYVQGRNSLLSRESRYGWFSQILQNQDGELVCEYVNRNAVSVHHLESALEFRDSIWFLELCSNLIPVLHNATSGHPVVAESNLPFYHSVFIETHGGQLVHPSVSADFILNRELGWSAYKLWPNDCYAAPGEIAEGSSVLYSTSYSSLYARDIRAAQPHEMNSPVRDLGARIYSIDENVYVVHNNIISIYDERNNALVGMQISAPDDMGIEKPIRK